MKNILIITGAQGTGKSQLATFIADWCSNAKVFHDNEPVDVAALPKDRPVVIVTNDARLVPSSLAGSRRIVHVHLDKRIS